MCRRNGRLNFRTSREQARREDAYASVKRPIALTVLMWFAALYAFGAVAGLIIEIAGLGRYSIGGIPVSPHEWLIVAAPLIASIAALMAITAIGLRGHRPWARTVFMCIWPLIAVYGLISGVLHTVPWSLAWRAVIDATVVGLIAAWILYYHRPSVEYFRSIQTR